jgi:hypothetical protein
MVLSWYLRLILSISTKDDEKLKILKIATKMKTDLNNLISSLCSSSDMVIQILDIAKASDPSISIALRTAMIMFVDDLYRKEKWSLRRPLISCVMDAIVQLFCASRQHISESTCEQFAFLLTKSIRYGVAPRVTINQLALFASMLEPNSTTMGMWHVLGALVSIQRRHQVSSNENPELVRDAVMKLNHCLSHLLDISCFIAAGVTFITLARRIPPYSQETRLSATVKTRLSLLKTMNIYFYELASEPTWRADAAIL